MEPVADKEKCLEDLWPDTKPKRFGWGVRHVQMGCMFACMTALFVSRGAMAVAVLAMTDRSGPGQAQVYSWDKETQGVVLSSFFWGYMAMQVPAGVLAKRFGGQPILLVALLANAALCALLPAMAQLGGWRAVCAARVCMGLAQACLFPASHTLLGRWLPAHERTALTGIVYAGSMLGTIISMPAAGLLSATAWGWPLVFYVLAGVLLAAAALWAALAASEPARHRLMTSEERDYIEADFNTGTGSGRSLRTPWLAVARSPAVWAIVAAHFGMCAAFTLFFVDMPTYLEHGLGISLKSSAWLSALPYVGMWVGNVSSAVLCERIHNRGWLSLPACRRLFNSISFYGVTVGLTVLSFLGPEHKHLAVATLVLTLTCKGASTAGFMVNHLDLSPNFAGVLLSITNFLANTSSVVIPILTGVILRSDPTDVSRWRVVFLGVAALAALTNTVYVVFSRFERQPWDDPNYGTRHDTSKDTEENKPVLDKEKQERTNDYKKEDEANKS